MSFDDIADAVGVSQPTVTRMMRQLGYASALEWRVAAALQETGRLHPDQIRCAAAMIHAGHDLHIFVPEVLDRAVEDIFKRAFPKTDVHLPMKPQIIRRRDVRTTPQRFNEGDAALILAISALPVGYDFEAEIRNASACSVPVLLIQAVTFAIPWKKEAVQVVSLGLEADMHDALAAIHLAAAVAEIRQRAAQM